VLAVIAMLESHVKKRSDDAGVSRWSRVEQVHCRRFKGQMCRIRCVVEFLNARLLRLRQGPKIFATTANLPNRIKRFRKILVPLDRRIDRIDRGRGRQNSGGDRSGNGAAGRKGEQVPPRRVNGPGGLFADEFVGGVLCTRSAWVIGFASFMARVRAGAED
jgi:hypothetical protein